MTAEGDIKTNRPISRRRLWLFRIIAITVIPAVVLVVLEMSLRVVGYGYSASPLSRIQLKSETAYCNNHEFGWRFWPRSIAREFEPFTFTAKKAKDTYRIFVLGGSAALGTPEPSYSFGRSLEIMLKNQYPQVNFEIINTAITASNSHVVLPIAKACASVGDGDLFIVYLGNNEVIGPYGAGTIFASLSDSMTFIRFDKAMQTMKLGQLLKNTLKSNRSEKTLPKEWGGTEMFMENLIRADDENLRIVYEHYKKNMEDITRTLRQKGAEVILCSVGSNIKDNAPFASLHRADITDDEKQKWESLYSNGVEFEVSEKYEQALECFISAAGIDDEHAELHFRMAKAYWKIGRFEEARKEFIVARQRDALRIRADNRINQNVYEVAQSNKGNGVYYVDSVKAFEQHSPNRTPGEELFYEHVHLNFKGNYVLAEAIFRQVENILPEHIKSKRADVGGISEEQCAQRLAFTKWDQSEIISKNLETFFKKPPFINRLYNDDLIERVEKDLQGLNESLDAQALTEDQQRYITAIENAPHDWWLHWKYARFLTDGLNNPSAAAQQYRIVTELQPGSYLAFAKSALSLFTAGDLDGAIASSLEALEINSYCSDAHHVLGLSYGQKGDTDRAMKHYTMQVRISPNHSHGYNRMGVILDKQGKASQAEEIYRTGLELCPEDVALHYNLALLLAKQNRFNDAIECINAGLNSVPNPAPLLGLLNKIKATGR